MAYSNAFYTADGTNRTFPVPFPYIDGNHVEVYIGSTRQTAVALSSPGTVYFTQAAPPAGAAVTVLRNTPKGDPLAVFSDTSTLTATDLKLNARQAIYSMQEALDRAAEANARALDALARADGAVSSAVSYADAGDARTIANANAYTNAAVKLASGVSPEHIQAQTIRSGAPADWVDDMLGFPRGLAYELSPLVSVSAKAEPGILVASRSSDTNSTGQDGWCIGSFVLNDNVDARRPMYCTYLEARKAYGAGPTQGIEVCVINGGPFVPRSPYQITSEGDTIPLLVSAGRSDVPGVDSTVGVCFGGGGGAPDQRFATGIAFRPGSLRPGAHPSYPGYSVAIDMLNGDSIVWRNPVNEAVAGYIRAEVNSAAPVGSIVLNAQGTVLNGPTANAQFIVGDGYFITTAGEFNGTVNAKGALNVSGNTLMAGALEAHGAVSFTGSADIRGGLVVAGSISCNSDCGFYSGLILSGLPVFADNASAPIPAGYCYVTPDGTVKRKY